MLLTAEDVTKLKPKLDGKNLIRNYLQNAVVRLNDLTCGAVATHLTGEQIGIVQEDGVSVLLPSWFSTVTKVMDGARELAFTFTPTVGDMQTEESIVPTAYGRVVTLSTSNYGYGRTVSVSGEYGFTTLPDSLKNALIALMSAFSDRDSGTDYITSKSIEDVKVDRTATEKLTLSPEESALQSIQGIVDMWSLCTDKYHLGTLSFPHKLDNAPYWVNEADYPRAARGIW